MFAPVDAFNIVSGSVPGEHGHSSRARDCYRREPAVRWMGGCRGAPPRGFAERCQAGERRDGESPMMSCEQTYAEEPYRCDRGAGHPRRNPDRIRRRQCPRGARVAREGMEPLEAGGSHPGGCRAATAISVVPNGSSGWTPKRRILTLPQVNAIDDASFDRLAHLVERCSWNDDYEPQLCARETLGPDGESGSWLWGRPGR